MGKVKIQWQVLKNTARGTDLVSKEKYNVNGNEGHFKVVSVAGEWGTIWELWINDNRLCNVWHNKCTVKRSAIHEVEMDSINLKNEIKALEDYTKGRRKWDGQLQYCIKRVERLYSVKMR